jgi:hypothetical protein
MVVLIVNPTAFLEDPIWTPVLGVLEYWNTAVLKHQLLYSVAPGETGLWIMGLWEIMQTIPFEKKIR